MSNAILGWPIYSDVGVAYTPTLSGGSWSVALPLTNLQDRRLQKVARSTNALAASTLFEVDLGVARAVRVLALPVHNLGFTATIRVRGGSVAGMGSGVLHDSGTVNVYAAGLNAENTQGMNVGWTYALPSDVTARYWRFEIVDTGNPAGYIDIGRLIVAAGWQPTYNVAIGADVSLETGTVRTETDAFSAVFTERKQRRTARFSIKNLAESEAYGSAFDLQRIAGTSGQLHFVFNPDDTTLMHRRSFLATLRRLTGVQYPYATLTEVPFELVEEL